MRLWRWLTSGRERHAKVAAQANELVELHGTRLDIGP
jgi:hypothetical protein